jgi:CheY-like chemotaxis protein
MKRRILLADDSVTIQKVIELTFMDEDFEVRAVSNGDEALALLPEVKPDIVIADVHMPGANGYEVCRRSKAARPGVPVLLLVGTFEPFDENESRSAGADSFLKKPFDSQELLQRVQDLLATQGGGAATPEASLPTLDFPAMPALEQPAFAAEPSWGSFDLEPAAPAFSPSAFEPSAFEPSAFEPAPEPFDREPSFSLEPDPDYKVASEPVFALEEESGFAVQGDVFGAPAELSFEEPQDRYLPEDELVPPPPSSFQSTPASPASFDWAAPAPAAEPVFEAAPEPFQFQEPLPVWEPAPEPRAWEPEPQAWSAPVETPAWVEPEPQVQAWSAPASEPAPPAFEPPAYQEPEPVQAAPAFTPAPAAAPEASNGGGHLSDQDVDRIARRVVELLGDRTVRDVAWEVIPDMAEVIIRDRLRELEAQVE